jgi:hypothetical protein
MVDYRPPRRQLSGGGWGRGGVIRLRPNPWVTAYYVVRVVLLGLWLYRVELTMITLAWLAWQWLVEHTSQGWAGLLVGLVLVVMLATRWGRRFLIGHAWCVLIRHRIRTAFGQAGVTSREGRLPLVMHVAPTRVGTRVTVWMRAGNAVEQLGDEDSVKVGIVRAACWAREVRIDRSERWSHIVRLHLVRRDSLAAEQLVPSALSGLIDRWTTRHHDATDRPSVIDVRDSAGTAGGPLVPTPRNRVQDT